MIKNKRNLLKKVPNRFHPLLEGFYYTIFPENIDASLKTGPKRESINKYQIEDLTALVNRTSLLEFLPHSAKVAELGVAEGNFAESILTITDPDELYLIDTWNSPTYDESLLRSVKNKFKEEIDNDTVKIMRDWSVVALEENFDDGFFDWVYIDTTHTFEQTKAELEVSRKKVKQNGIISGHDYCMVNGVIPAVHNFCNEYDWKIIYMTFETDGRSSFALQKM
jgi:hypothetical protein